MSGRSSRADDTAPLVAHPYKHTDPTSIPPRAWIFGTIAIRAFITLLAAPGGVGKSSWGIMVALACATGLPLLGEPVFQRAPVWVFNLEDPLEESERRVAAAMKHHDLKPEDIDEWLFIHSGRDRPVTIATLGSSTDGKHNRIIYPDKAQIIQEAKRLGIGLIIVDPFINSHELDENSNVAMNAAARAWAEIAAEVQCSVILVHHTRKGAAGNTGDIEGARGAKALSDAARVGLTLAPMNEEQANKYGVPPSEKWRYIRLDDGKQNMAAQADRPRWLHLVSVSLDNGTAAYPDGDSVQVVEVWEPTTRVLQLSDEQKWQVLAQIQKGMPDGRRYGESNKGGSSRWAGQLIVDLGHSAEDAKAIIAGWIASGVLKRVTRRDVAKGRDVVDLDVTSPEATNADVE